MKRQSKNSGKGIIREFVHLLEHSLAAWIILVLSLLLTYGAWLISSRTHQSRLQERFDHRVSVVVSDIEERLLEYEQVLRGGVGLFASSKRVDRQEWATYVEHCEIDTYFPGIQGMGVAIPVPATEIGEHEAAVRAEGFDQYRIRPEGERDFYTSIVYLEPFDWRNRRAFGYDMYSDATRREAMDRAIATGEPAMSGMVTLVQETDKDVQKGWLYYLPMFEADASASAEVQGARKFTRDDLTGFVYAAFRANDLMSGVIGDGYDDVKVEIYDSNEIDPDRLLYDSDGVPHADDGDGSDFASLIPLNIRGRDWLLHFESYPALFESIGNHQSSIIAFGGLLVDFLLFIVIAAIGQQKIRAMRIAKVMTVDVRAREQLIGKILANVSEAIITVDDRGRIETANKAAKTMLGLTRNDPHIDFNEFLGCQSWWSLVAKLNETDDEQYKCSVNASRANGESFVCRLNMGSFTANAREYHIVVAQDETGRIESEKKMDEINDELIKASRTAGKVELANGVLHNVGNIVNSINVSTGVIKKRITGNSVSKLDRICRLIEEHESDFIGFVQNDSRGKKIPDYLQKLRDAFVTEQTKVDEELCDLLKNVSHIKEVITSQQSAAKTTFGPQSLNPGELLDDAIIANKATLAIHDVEIEKQVESRLPELRSEKHKILQILVNLIKNANDALVENQTSNPKIIVEVYGSENEIVFKVIDNGIGIEPQKIDKIFSHGFTTKRTGHGFGLHSSLRAAMEIGATLTVSSDGVGTGATFKLAVPLMPDNERGKNEPIDKDHSLEETLR